MKVAVVGQEGRESIVWYASSMLIRATNGIAVGRTIGPFRNSSLTEFAATNCVTRCLWVSTNGAVSSPRRVCAFVPTIARLPQK